MEKVKKLYKAIDNKVLKNVGASIVLDDVVAGGGGGVVVVGVAGVAGGTGFQSILKAKSVDKATTSTYVLVWFLSSVAAAPASVKAFEVSETYPTTPGDDAIA